MSGPWVGCRRRTDDPLLRLSIDRYHVHLLAIPREGAVVGDLYVEQDGVVGTPGRIDEVLSGDFVLPEQHVGERLADISGQLTRSVDAVVGVRISELLLGSLGIPAGAGLTSAINRSTGVRFQFHEVFRTSVDVLALGRALMGCRLIREHPVIAGATAHFYLTAAVLTTKMISLLVDGVSGIDLGAQIDATGVAGIKASTSRAGAGQVRLESDVALAFAVELYELEFVPETDGVRLRRTVVPVRVRNSRRVVNRERLVPAEIGGLDGSLFI
jgi:hypothetical protein